MKRIINCETGEVIEREFNKGEKDQQKIDETAYLKIKAQETAKVAERLAIANRLGLTPDELQILLG
jgi:hypothetical protein